MTQLTKREQIALAIFLERYKVEEVQSISEMIACSTDHADRFLKHLSETEPDLMPIKKEDIIKESKDTESQEEPMSAEDIAHWVWKCDDFTSVDCDVLERQIKALVAYEVNKAKQSKPNEDEHTN